jgi:hypothetical protein
MLKRVASGNPFLYFHIAVCKQYFGMKTICFLLIPLLFSTKTGAQSWKKDTVILSAGFGALFLRHPGHAFMKTAPYTVTSVLTGSTTDQNFNGSLNGPFNSAMYLVDLLKVEILHKQHAIDFGLGMNRDLGNTYGAYLRGGYAYIFTFHGFLLKPGMDLLYLFGRNENMGSIDNSDKTISLLGYTSRDQFTVGTTDGDGNTTYETYNTDHLDVDYHRTNLIAEPKVTLSSRQLSRQLWRFSLNLEAGWFVQAFQSNVIRLVQVGDDKNSTEHTLGSVHIKNDGAVSGAYIGLSVGIEMGHKVAG